MIKKYSKVLIVLLLLVEFTFVFLSIKSFSNKNITKTKEINVANKKIFSIYVENDTTGEYEEKDDFPSINYILNYSKTNCIDNKNNLVENAISYNNGRVTITSNKTLYCYLYFNLPLADLTVNLNGTTGTNQIGKFIKSIDCGTTGSAIFNPIYQRIEFESASSPAECILKYTSDTTNYTTLKSKVETVNANQNYDGNGYRYSGKNPNNWIWFNGEKWRIIGSIPTCTSSNCATQENLVKIIRNESIGSYLYDAKTDYEGEWGYNTLYMLLNTHYYASDASALNGQNHVGCYMSYSENTQVKPNCDYTETGILSSSYYGQMVRRVYWNTGSTTDMITALNIYANEIETQKVLGYVGLMSLSDWGYAADEIYHSTKIESYSSAAASWLFNYNYEWTSIQNSSNNGSAENYTFCVEIVSSATAPNSAKNVRPVVYLDSSVYIVSGDGTISNPYIIGM